MGSGVNRMMTGSVVGTGSAINVRTVTFRPRKVEILNVGGVCSAVWTDTMADASALKTVDSGAGATDVSLITSNGITPLNNGFTIGADTDLNVSGETIHWVAYQ